MFTSVVGALTSLLPKYFIFGSYVPVLIFSFVNLVLVYVFSAWSRSGIEFWLGKSAALTIGVAFVGTVVIAYVVSAINDFLREFLEGKHVWPRGFERALCAEQRRRRELLETRYEAARRHHFLLRGYVEAWERQLRDAGTGIVTPGTVKAGGNLMAIIRATVRRGALGEFLHDPLPEEEFAKLVTALGDGVAETAAIIAALPGAVAGPFESSRRDLLLMVGAILNSMAQLEYETGTELFTRFGNDPVRPTRMGNVADAIHAYAIGRYKIELTVFFSRLTTILVQKEDKGYPLVLDAKTQLDFLVACCWFTALTTTVWASLLLSFGGSPIAYGCTVIVGFLITVAFYYLASENYLSYGEVVRACIDINRFSLLTALDIRLPDSLREERALWSTMSNLAFSGGDSVEFSYDRAKK